MDTKKPSQFSKLLDWLEGRLSEEETQALEQALATADEDTLENLHWLRHFLELSAGLTLASPPPEVRAALSQRFADYAGERRSPNFFQRIRASLTFDSRAQMATAGLRSATSETTQRQLIYATLIAEIAVNILPGSRPKEFNLLGQVFPTADITPDAFSIHLLRDTMEAGLTASDELGEFAFKDIAEGSYDLILSTDRYEVAIPIQLNR